MFEAVNESNKEPTDEYNADKTNKPQSVIMPLNEDHPQNSEVNNKPSLSKKVQCSDEHNYF